MVEPLHLELIEVDDGILAEIEIADLAILARAVSPGAHQHVLIVAREFRTGGLSPTFT